MRHAAFGVGLEDMPPDVLMRIMELIDYDMNLFAASQRIRDEPTAAMHVARKLILCAHPEETESKSLPWLTLEFRALNVHRILEVVVRGHPTTGDDRHIAPLRDAILRIARTRDDAAHDALLVRAPLFQRIATCVRTDREMRVSEKLKYGARELFHALRPSVKRAIRSERIGARFLYADATDEEMRRLVRLVGRHSFKNRDQLAVAVVGYMRDNTGESGSLIHSHYGNPPEPVTAATTYADVYGPLCFWNMHHTHSLRGIFSPEDVRGMWPDEPHYSPGDVLVALPALGEFSADLYWPTQNVRDLSATFATSCFDGRVGHLNTSRVTHMERTFLNNPVFNQPLANWDIRYVRFMDDMFSGALSFNQPLGAWDVTSVESAHRMFADTPSFNQPLDKWVMYRAVATAMFRNSAFAHTIALDVLGSRDAGDRATEWARGRRMKAGRVVDAASLVANGLRRWVPEGWYEENTVTFDRGLPQRRSRKS